MKAVLEYEPNIRKNRLLHLLTKLADPNVTSKTLKEVSHDDALPYVWRWQDDLEGHFFKEKTEVTEPLGKATANLVRRLQELVTRNRLPRVEDNGLKPSAAPATNSLTTETKSQEDPAGTSSRQSSESSASSRNSQPNRPDSPQAERDEKRIALSDTDIKLEGDFQTVCSEDAEFISSALAFLFHAADGSGGAVYNLLDAVNFTDLGRVASSLLYVKNLEVSMAATRVLGQVVGASRYFPPASIPRLLLTMALNVPCGNGSSVKANSATLASFANGETKLEDVVQMLGKDPVPTDSGMLCSFYKMARLRLKTAYGDARQRSMLVAQQAYSIATLMVLLGESGFECLVLSRAPNALSALTDVCRDNLNSPENVYLKSCIVESLTIFLSFMGSAHNTRLFKRLQLAPLLSEFHKPDINERYFYQLCDLASFAPSQTVTYPLKMIQLSTSAKFSTEAKLRSIDVLTRTFDPPMHTNGVVSDQISEKVYLELFKAFECDLDELLAKSRLCVNSPNASYDELCSKRVHELVTERLDSLNLFIIPLSWTSIERTVLKSPLIDRLLSVLTLPLLLETLPTRAVHIAADTLARICETEQGRMLLLDEQGLKFSIYDALILLARSHNRRLDLLPAIEALYMCLWGAGEQEDRWPTLDSVSARREGQPVEHDRQQANRNFAAQAPAAVHSNNDASVDHTENVENNAGQFLLDELDLALMRQATEVLVHSICECMPKLVVEYSRRAAKECVTSFASIIQNTRLHKVDDTPWVVQLIESYGAVVRSIESRSISLNLDTLIGPLYTADYLGGEVAGLVLYQAVLSGDLQLTKILKRPVLEDAPHILENYCRLFTELATEGFPVLFVRFLRYSDLLVTDRLSFLAQILPKKLVVKLILGSLESVGKWSQEDYEDFETLIEDMDSSYCGETVGQTLELLKSSSSIVRLSSSGQEDEVEKMLSLLNLLNKLLPSSASRLNSVDVQLLTRIFQESMEADEASDVQEALLNLFREILSSESFSGIREDLTTSLEEIVSKYGMKSFEILKGVLPEGRECELLVEQLEESKLEAALRDCHSSLLRVIRALPSEFISNNSHKLLHLLTKSVDRVRSNVSGPSFDCDSWLQLTAQLTIRLAASEHFEANSKFCVLLNSQAELIIRAISEQSLSSPVAFATLHTILLNSLNVQALIEIASLSRNQDLNEHSTATLSAFSGIPSSLPPMDVLKNFLRMSVWALDQMLSQSDDAEVDSIREFGIVGLGFVNGLIIQSSIQIANFAVEIDLLGKLINCHDRCPSILRRPLEECILSISHVIFTTPSIMAGLMIAQMNNNESKKTAEEDGSAQNFPFYSEPDALLMRRPFLGQILKDNFGLTSDASLVPFSDIELLARRNKVDLIKPDSLDTLNYDSLSSETQRKLLKMLLKLIESTFTSSVAAAKAKVSIKILLDYMSLSGKVRSILISGNDHLMQTLLFKFGIHNSPDNFNEECGIDTELLRLFVNLIANLTKKSRTESISHSTRKSIERSTRFVLKIVNHTLTRKVPELLRTDRRQAVSVILTCVEIIRLVWGDSKMLLANLPLMQNATGEKCGSELIQHQLIKDMRVIENLVATFSLFDFAWEDLGRLKMSALRFLDCLLFQELFKIDIEGDRAVQLLADQNKSKETSSDHSPVDEEGRPLISTHEHGSFSDEDEDEDFIESAAAEERRLQHRQRAEASHGNTFRNSSLGEYESSSSDSMISGESEGTYDSDEGSFTESEDYGSESYESDHMVDGLSDNQAEIMLVLSEDEDADVRSFYTSDDYDSERGDYTSDSFFDGDEEQSTDDYEDEAGYEIVLNDTESAFTRNMSLGELNGRFGAPASHGDHQFELDDEVLLLYDERREDDYEGHHRSTQVSSRIRYLRSVFESFDELDPSRAQSFYGDLQYRSGVKENSGLLWDSLSLPWNSEKVLRSTFDANTLARRFAQANKESGTDRYQHVLQIEEKLPQIVVKRKSEDDPRSGYFPQLLALLARVCFSDSLDLEFDLIHHCIIALAGTSTGRQLFKTLIHILLEASSGHTDSVYASLTRIAASGSSVKQSDAVLSLKVRVYSSPALVCSNILRLLEEFFSADFLVDNPRFLWNNGNHQVCGFENCELFYLDTISSMAKKLLKKQGAEMLGMISNPVIAGNRRLLELASSLLDYITTASSDTWDPTAPEEYTDDEVHNDADSEFEKINLSIDEHKTSKILSVLSSRECNFRVFSSMVKILKKHVDFRILVDPLIKEIRKAKHLLVVEGRRMLEDHNTASGVAEPRGQHDFLEAQLQFLRLLNVVGSIFVGESCLHIFRKVDLPPLWTKIFAVIEFVQQMEGLVPQLMLSLLEVVTLPADIIFREYDSLYGGSEGAQNLYAGYIGDLTTSLQTCMPKYGGVINELIRVKPKLLGGPLGAMALRFKVVDFKNKCDWLSQEIYTYKNERYAEERVTFVINRDNIFKDSLSLISGLKGQKLLYPFNIEFENEPGVDEGGVTREWYELLSREILNPLYGLFCPTTPGSSIYQIRPPLEGVEEQEQIYRFVGRVIGRAVYDQYTVGLYFSRVVYKYFLGDPITLADMESFDESYYKSLRWMLENDITDVFYENFSIEIDKYGTTEIEDLIPNGRNISVDETNKQEYVKRVVEYKLVTCVKGPLDAMKQGFYDVLLKSWVKTFNDQELELLICGLPSIDIDDWYANTRYEGYNAGSKQVRWFWLAVRSFSPELRAKLLQFSTGTSRVPAQGFGHLESNTDSGKFIISREKGNKDRLPSAHTCMNQLCIPEYETYGKFRKLLLKAITEGNEGFGFI